MTIYKLFIKRYLLFIMMFIALVIPLAVGFIVDFNDPLTGMLLFITRLVFIVVLVAIIIILHGKNKTLESIIKVKEQQITRLESGTRARRKIKKLSGFKPNYYYQWRKK